METKKINGLPVFSYDQDALELRVSEELPGLHYISTRQPQ